MAPRPFGSTTVTSAEPSTAAATRDRLLDGRVVLWQPAKGYRAAIDPVLLAAAADPPRGARVVDLGCGVGAASLCLLARRPDLTVEGVEREPVLADLARRNAARNSVEDRFRVVEADVAGWRPAVPADLVLCNPPYLEAGAADASPDPIKRAASIDDLGLPGWVSAARRALGPGGALMMIHRADRLDAVIRALDGFGSLDVLPIAPREGAPASRVILAATLGGRAPTGLLAPFIIHQGDAFTPIAEAVLRHGAPVPLTGRASKP